MGKELTDLPFETWVTFVFDHPAPDSDTPTAVETIITQFLKRHSALRSELKAYALAAQQGLVL